MVHDAQPCHATESQNRSGLKTEVSHGHLSVGTQKKPSQYAVNSSGFCPPFFRPQLLARLHSPGLRLMHTKSPMKNPEASNQKRKPRSTPTWPPLVGFLVGGGGFGSLKSREIQHMIFHMGVNNVVFWKISKNIEPTLWKSRVTSKKKQPNT